MWETISRWMSELEASLVHTVLVSKIKKSVPMCHDMKLEVEGWEIGVKGPLRWPRVPLLCSRWERGGNSGFSRVPLGSWQEQRQDLFWSSSHGRVCGA